MIGLILQEELSSSEKPLYEVGKKSDTKFPRTIIVYSTDQYLNFSRADLFDGSKKYGLVRGDDTYYWGILTEKGVRPTQNIHYSKDGVGMYGLEVPKEVASYYRLTEGDQIDIEKDDITKIVYISSVNNERDPKVFRAWPTDLSGFQSEYPKKPLPVEKFGDPDLRAITLLAPIGLGAAYWVIAPGGAGKTWLLAKILEACLLLSLEMDNLYILMGYVGDRPEDAALYIEIFNKYKRAKGAFHKAPWNTLPDAQVDVTNFVMRRARRMTAIGRNVIVLFDSMSRTVAVHTASSYADGDGGMISGGIKRGSLTEMIALQFGTHGYFDENRSLTIIGTVLSSSDTKKTSESAVDQETSDSSTTAICRLVKIPTLERPWISVNEAETNTRYPNGHDFRSEKQKQEMAAVRATMRDREGGTSSYIAHGRLIDYVRKHPLPSY
ncbi:MAG: hypothetical protein UU64_C0002G0046 [candidate division WWE3 bacterium GW2011_GWF2_41_45]|uniref:ATPase F1/V1/A1 complex alpha/beta subunit nucleotide-binding domain-containing protein n=3 Tax=Katanobacteria TaxID=422282 RepID=A0A1F4W3I2_UNCKA|nr:MAG: hypothetical protein UU55_C0001G0072 [candidate division WWE3 bacterium GW2011_GWC2_41_23]KKS10644.1 MAG: hypothetical protein UU64_C0002G0046 [candidate division WWE3 bacterium GW2011_GWF2_41_45]KKS12345.1 MAG: hypothetical protein UU68_C0002G0071 [candidate division WWE3 bacterium GW2011_GWF1_41_53]KKS20419.1 MAG: hypothetical protein UU79_C0001G0073 [candidate division WWE3 bacterium GW2011_GWE1_41_72]KKS27160.1 MAG: hypothetical protein UU86_C0024G0008 [candidate division WWE3 bacte